jgi:hypothetical protein
MAFGDGVFIPQKFSRPIHRDSVEEARLVRRYHVLDVDVSILAAMTLEHFQCFLDQIAEVFSLSLAVVDAITRIH